MYGVKGDEDCGHHDDDDDADVFLYCVNKLFFDKLSCKSVTTRTDHQDRPPGQTKKKKHTQRKHENEEKIKNIQKHNQLQNNHSSLFSLFIITDIHFSELHLLHNCDVIIDCIKYFMVMCTNTGAGNSNNMWLHIVTKTSH